MLSWYNSLRGISVQYKGCYHHLFALFSMDTVRRILMDLPFLEVEGFKKADCQQTSLWSQPVTLHSGGYCTESVWTFNFLCFSSCNFSSQFQDIIHQTRDETRKSFHWKRVVLILHQSLITYLWRNVYWRERRITM